MRRRDQSNGRKIIELTCEKYSELTGKPVSRENATEIIESLCEYSKVLIEIDQEINKNDKSGVIDGL